MEDEYIGIVGLWGMVVVYELNMKSVMKLGMVGLHSWNCNVLVYLISN